MPVESRGGSDRDSLQAILRRVYVPQRPRPAHQCDANAVGVVAFGRTAKIASHLQQQFEGGAAEVRAERIAFVHPLTAVRVAFAAMRSAATEGRHTHSDDPEQPDK